MKPLLVYPFCVFVCNPSINIGSALSGAEVKRRHGRSVLRDRMFTIDATAEKFADVDSHKTVPSKLYSADHLGVIQVTSTGESNVRASSSKSALDSLAASRGASHIHVRESSPKSYKIEPKKHDQVHEPSSWSQARLNSNIFERDKNHKPHVLHGLSSQMTADQARTDTQDASGSVRSTSDTSGGPMLEISSGSKARYRFSRILKRVLDKMQQGFNSRSHFARIMRTRKTKIIVVVVYAIPAVAALILLCFCVSYSSPRQAPRQSIDDQAVRGPRCNVQEAHEPNAHEPNHPGTPLSGNTSF